VNESLQILATLAATQVVLNMSPGPNMLLVIQAATHDRRLGLAVAAGIWPIGILWATAGLTGLGAAVTAVPEIGLVMRIACGLYLGWLGVQAVRRSFAPPAGAAGAGPRPMTYAQAFRAGVITNITNPKSTAYYLSVFAATGAFGMTPFEQVAAVVMMPTISFAWNVVLALVVASAPVAGILGRGRPWFDRLAGGVMILFGLKLLTARD
jgi:threonine/homoserine/homoserine lactone efflux protein